MSWLNSAITGVGNFVKSPIGGQLVNLGSQALVRKVTKQPIGNFADQALPFASAVAFKSSPTGSTIRIGPAKTWYSNPIVLAIGGFVLAVILFFTFKRK